MASMQKTQLELQPSVIINASVPATFEPQWHHEWISETLAPNELVPKWLRRSDSTGSRQAICLSAGCVESAAFLLQRINFNVDPCANFYEFACGKFLQSHTVPDDHLSRNILQEIQDEIYVEMKGFLESNNTIELPVPKHTLANDANGMSNNNNNNKSSVLGNNAVRKARLFYRSCMNESTVNNEPEAVQVLIRLLTDNYQVRWPLLDQIVFRNDTWSSGDDHTIDLERRMFLVFLHQIQPLLHFYVAPEELKTQSKEYALHLYSGTTVLESGYLLNDTITIINNGQEYSNASVDYQLAYGQLQVDILCRLSELLGKPKFNKTEALRHVRKVIDFEMDLARITKNFTDTSTVLAEDASLDASDLTLDELSLNITLISGSGGNSANSANPSATLNSQTSSSRKVHYERIRPMDLQKTHSFMNWSRLLHHMELISETKINQILVESSEHLIQIGHLIQRHSRRTAENYLCWATVARFLPYLGAHFRRLYADFRRKVPDLSQNTDAPLEFTSLNQKWNLMKWNKWNLHGFDVMRERKLTLTGASVHRSVKTTGSGTETGSESRSTSTSTSASGSGSGRLFLSRWKECVHLTTEGLKSASAVLYVQQRQHLVQSVSEHVTRLVHDMQQAFERMVDAQPWLDEPAVRLEIKRRAQTIRSRIALPMGLLRSADDALANLQIEVHAVFVANIVAMLRHEMTNELKRLNQVPDSERDWLMEPLVPNAYYDSLNHFIILPLAILRKPLVNSNRPIYLDYATLGVVIGHEIAHAFDSGTRKEMMQMQMSLNNNSSTHPELGWWSRGVNMQYEQNARCFASQFGNYLIAEINENINGNLTLEENICDFAGLQQAYLAYKRDQANHHREQVLLPGLANFTTDQLFFVQYAQVWCEISNREGYKKSLLDSHAPGRFRANGVVSNSPQYAQAFKCAPGQPMNPINKCSLWSSANVRL